MRNLVHNYTCFGCSLLKRVTIKSFSQGGFASSISNPLTFLNRLNRDFNKPIKLISFRGTSRKLKIKLPMDLFFHFSQAPLHNKVLAYDRLQFVLSCRTILHCLSSLRLSLWNLISYLLLVQGQSFRLFGWLLLTLSFFRNLWNNFSLLLSLIHFRISVCTGTLCGLLISSLSFWLI